MVRPIRQNRYVCFVLRQMTSEDPLHQAKKDFVSDRQLPRFDVVITQGPSDAVKTTQVSRSSRSISQKQGHIRDR